MTDRERGQMVLLAAVAIAVALVPLLLAYMQLGYHPDVAGPRVDHTGDVERTLSRSLVAATANIPSEYDWSRRTAAVTEVRDRLGETVTTLNRSGLARATAIQVSYNETLAADWISNRCPDGPDRQFGPCEAVRGVAVQERGGETHVLGAAFDVRILREDATITARPVIER